MLEKVEVSIATYRRILGHPVEVRIEPAVKRFERGDRISCSFLKFDCAHTRKYGSELISHLHEPYSNVDQFLYRREREWFDSFTGEVFLRVLNRLSEALQRVDDSATARLVKRRRL